MFIKLTFMWLSALFLQVELYFPNQNHLGTLKMTTDDTYLESCGRLVPALKRVGEAWVNHLSERRLYVSIAASISSSWIPTDTLINICCGLSATKNKRSFKWWDMSEKLNWDTYLSQKRTPEDNLKNFLPISTSNYSKAKPKVKNVSV